MTELTNLDNYNVDINIIYLYIYITIALIMVANQWFGEMEHIKRLVARLSTTIIQDRREHHIYKSEQLKMMSEHINRVEANNKMAIEATNATMNETNAITNTTIEANYNKLLKIVETTFVLQHDQVNDTLGKLSSIINDEVNATLHTFETEQHANFTAIENNQHTINEELNSRIGNLKIKIETSRSELLTGILDTHKVLKIYIKKQEECNKKMDKIESKTTNQYNNVLLVQSQTSDQFSTELTKLTVQCDRHSAQNLQNCIQLNECINMCKDNFIDGFVVIGFNNVEDYLKLLYVSKNMTVFDYTNIKWRGGYDKKDKGNILYLSNLARLQLVSIEVSLLMQFIIIDDTNKIISYAIHFPQNTALDRRDDRVIKQQIYDGDFKNVLLYLSKINIKLTYDQEPFLLDY